MYGVSPTTSTHTFVAMHFAPMLAVKRKRNIAIGSTLKTLTVALQPSGFIFPAFLKYKDNPTRANHALDVLLASCRNLEHLILTFVRGLRYTERQHQLKSVEQSLEKCKLQTLVLNSGISIAEDLMDLLWSHQSSMRHLVLSGVELEDGDEWRSCLAWITQELSLESVALLGINTMEGSMCVNLGGEIKEIRVNITGQAEITTNATALVASMEEMELEDE